MEKNKTSGSTDTSTSREAAHTSQPAADKFDLAAGDYLYMIRQAVKAPSGHNTQPWLFRVQSRTIEILPDFARALPVVDGDGRELFISLGCAVENLCLAAAEKGYEATVVSMGAEGVTIALAFSSGITVDPLAAQIGLRQTHRGVYTGRPIPRPVIEACLSGSTEKDQPVYGWEKGTSSFDRAADYIQEGNRLQMNDSAFKSELKSWMRFNRKHTEERNDGLTYAVFGAPDLPRFISEPVMAACLSPRLQNKSDRKKIESSSHLVLFTTCRNDVEDWIRLGRRLERFLLGASRAGLAYAFLNQPCECKTLAQGLQADLQLGEACPQLLLRLGYAAKPMPYAPRRRPEEMILSGPFLC